MTELAMEDPTNGALEAMKRLAKGERLEREHERSTVRWKGSTRALHHLTVKNLLACGALKEVRGRKGFDTFGLSDTGRDLLKRYR